MANADVLDILSDTIPTTIRAAANKDEIIREKVILILIFSYCFLSNVICLFIRKKVLRKVFVDQKV